MSKVAQLKHNTEWQTALNDFNKSKQEEPIFITTDLDYTDADILLEDNDHNRNLSERRVQRYLRFMRDGKWLLNGECIKVSDKGLLLDGQHRLEALKRFNGSVRMAMVLGVNEKTFTVNDTGVSRNGGDILKIAGYKNYNGNAAALRWLLSYQDSETLSTSPDITPTDYIEAIKRWPHIQHFHTCAQPFGVLGRASAFHFFMYVTQTIEPEVSHDFFYKLETGEKLGKTSPILMLRKMLLKYKVSNLHLERRHLLASLIITWNAYYTKKRVTNIKWKGRDFPEIAGVDREKLFSKGSGLGVL